MHIEVVDDVAGVVAELLVQHGSNGEHIALTGGSTPKVAYERAAQVEADWSRSVLWFGDDRCVPPDDPRSNYGMAKAALLDHIDARVERIEGELGPDEGAARYDRRLHEHFGDDPFPPLDLILLGLGPDAHCASIFPGKPALHVRDRAVVGVPEAGLEPFVPRVTMTIPMFNSGREVVFMVTGESKAEAVVKAFGDGPREDAPASYVRPENLLVLLDPPAASLLDR
jgi:6-phosphogluconolactonase